MLRAALVVLCVASVPVYAQPAQLTKEFQAGVDAYRLGKYDEARTHLEAARAVDPKLPGPHRFLAVVARAQQRWDDCIASARTAMELNPRSSEIADTRNVHDECRSLAGRAPYVGELGDSGAIAVTTNVPGATVKVNGLTYGATPLAPRPITAGMLDVEVSKSGWKPTLASVNALPGIVTDVVVELEPDAAPPAEIVAEAPKTPKLSIETRVPGASIKVDGQAFTGGEVPPGEHLVEITAPGKDPYRRRVRVPERGEKKLSAELVDSDARVARERRGFYVLGAGGIVLAGGFVAAMLSRSAADEARDIVRIETSRDPTRPASETASVAPVRTRADLDDARDSASRWSLISNVTYGVGLATAGIGAYLLYRSARERTDVPPPFAIAPTRGGVFVAREVLAW